ncbi:MAG: AraC family transcriptional regulator [Pseudomonadota bacterium]
MLTSAAIQNATEASLAGFENGNYQIDAVARARRLELAAIKTTEAFEENTYAAWPTYMVILPTIMPDPVIKGAGETDLGRPTRAGAFSVAAPDHPGRWIVPSGAQFETIKVLLPEQLISALAVEAFGEQAENARLIDVHGDTDGTAVAYLRAIGDELMRGGGLSSLYLESAAQALALHLLRNHSTLTEPIAPARRALSQKRLASAIDFIEANLDQNLSLEQIAAAAHLSSFHFLRCFRDETGQTPHAYVTTRRVQRCRELLETSELPLSEIAYRCGFANQAHMTTVFKRAAGVPPGQYRREKTG